MGTPSISSHSTWKPPVAGAPPDLEPAQAPASSVRQHQPLPSAPPAIHPAYSPYSASEYPPRVSEQPNWFIRFVRSAFGFQKAPFTLLCSAIFAVVIAASYWASWSALSVPTPEPPILTSAWLDLQEITRAFHPYTSHANDDVHDYLLNRVTRLAADSAVNSIEISDDASRCVLFRQEDIFASASAARPSSRVVSLESNNIMVRIRGTDTNKGAILVSAHYDSVPAAFGATDNGVGVATVLGILEHFAQSQSVPKRTIVLLLNDGEELGLLGAEALASHPWSSELEAFVNLDGTGAGGRAMLFRATDFGVTQLYSYAPRPFGSSLFQEGFAKGIIKSETDYRVFANTMGLRGLDFAFYRPRSLYHTRLDSTQTTSRGAVWHMLSNTLGVVQAMAEADSLGSAEDSAVYSDVLGVFFVVVSRHAFVVGSIVALVVLPIVAILLSFLVYKRDGWLISGPGWLRAPIAAIVAGAATLGAAYLFYLVNPLVLMAASTGPFLVLVALYLFLAYGVLAFFHYVSPVHDQKLLGLIELMAALWLLVAIATVRAAQSEACTGEWLPLLLYLCVSAAVVVGLVSHIVAPKAEKFRRGVPEAEARPASSHGYAASASVPPSASVDFQPADDRSIDETAPLLATAKPTTFRRPRIHSFSYEWSLQLLLLLPVSWFAVFNTYSIVMEGVAQTATESSAAVELVVQLLTIAALTFGLLALPFAHRLHAAVPAVLLATVLVGGVYYGARDPFGPTSRLKLRFQQQVDLNAAEPVAVAVAQGPVGYVRPVLEALPSVQLRGVSVECHELGNGVESCEYSAEPPVLFAADSAAEAADFSRWLDVRVLNSTNKPDNEAESEKNAEAQSLGPLKADFLISAKECRFCTLSFNTTAFVSGEGRSPVKTFIHYRDTEKFRVPKNTSGVFGIEAQLRTEGTNWHKDAAGNDVFRYAKGFDEVNLLKLNWSEPLMHVGLEWIPRWLDDEMAVESARPANRNSLGVTVECVWGEYDDEVTVGGRNVRKLPAYDEVLEFSPAYVTWTNMGWGGFVKAAKYVEL